MAEVTQASADKRRVAQLGEKINDTVVVPIGGISFATGTSAPSDGASGSGKAMERGSMYVNRTTGKLHIKTSVAGASVTWVAVGSQS